MLDTGLRHGANSKKNFLRHLFYGKFYFPTDHQRLKRIEILFHTFFLKKQKKPKKLGTFSGTKNRLTLHKLHYKLKESAK